VAVKIFPVNHFNYVVVAMRTIARNSNELCAFLDLSKKFKYVSEFHILFICTRQIIVVCPEADLHEVTNM
jgi:hypothetical protein